MPALQTFLLPLFLGDLFLSLGALEVLFQVLLLCGLLFVESALPEPSDSLALPQSPDVQWAGDPDVLLIPSLPARTARIQTVRWCCWMCQSGRRPT